MPLVIQLTPQQAEFAANLSQPPMRALHEPVRIHGDAFAAVVDSIGACLTSFVPEHAQVALFAPKPMSDELGAVAHQPHSFQFFEGELNPVIYVHSKPFCINTRNAYRH